MTAPNPLGRFQGLNPRIPRRGAALPGAGQGEKPALRTGLVSGLCPLAASGDPTRRVVVVGGLGSGHAEFHLHKGRHL